MKVAKILVVSTLLVLVLVLLAIPGKPDEVELRLALSSQETSIWVGYGTPSFKKAIMSKVISGYGDIMYVESYRYNILTGTMTVNYVEDASVQIEEVRQVVTELTSQIQHLSEYQKVLWVNDYLTERVEYLHTGVSSDLSYRSLGKELYPIVTAYGALVNHVAICQGITSAAQLLLEELGLENQIRVGVLEGVSHSWNYVKVNGEYYNLDITNNKKFPYSVFLSADGYLEGYTSEEFEIDYSDYLEPFGYYTKRGMSARSKDHLVRLVSENGSGGYRLSKELVDSYKDLGEYLLYRLPNTSIMINGFGRVLYVSLD